MRLLGIGFGFFHGLIVSYGLMFYASERHPIETYKKATLEEGLLHFVGRDLRRGLQPDRRPDCLVV